MCSRCMVSGVLSTLLAATATFAGWRPLAVSPGDASKVLLTEDACPTFSWSTVAGADSYELVAYRSTEDGKEEEPVLRQFFPGAVSTWTPSLDRCLERGFRYAWAVRATGANGTTDWSEPNLFEVVAGPTAAEFEEALAVVRRYLAARQLQTDVAETESVATPLGTTRATPGRPATGPKAPGDFSIELGGFNSPKITLTDDTGEFAAFWFNSPFFWLDYSDGFFSYDLTTWTREAMAVHVPLQLPHLGGPYASGTDATPEVYELTEGPPVRPCNDDRRGMIAVMQPAAATSGGNPQDSLCYCGQVEGRYSWWCFNP